MLTEEGVLITNIKGIGEDPDFKMDEYTNRLDKIINKKIAYYADLKKKIEIYRYRFSFILGNILRKRMK